MEDRKTVQNTGKKRQKKQGGLRAEGCGKSMSVEGVNRGVIKIGYIPTTKVKFGNFMMGIGLATVAAASSNVGTTYAKIVGVLACVLGFFMLIGSIYLTIYLAASGARYRIFKKTALKHLTDEEITIDLAFPITDSPITNSIDRIPDNRRKNLVTAINYLIQKQAKQRNLNNEDYWRLLQDTDEWVAREIMEKTADSFKPNFSMFLRQCLEQYQEGKNRIWSLRCEVERCRGEPRNELIDHANMLIVTELRTEDDHIALQHAKRELLKQQIQTALMQRLLTYFWWHTNPSEVQLSLRIQFGL